jgi:hypothetical protein
MRRIGGDKNFVLETLISLRWSWQRCALSCPTHPKVVSHSSIFKGGIIMTITKKVLWIVSMDNPADEKRFSQHVGAAGIDTVCIRTDSPMLPDTIGRFHALGKKVWAWRWPGVIPKNTGTYSALNQARYVANVLIPAGLEGYIVDPESDHVGDNNDWNQKKLARIAQQFCKIIRDGANGKPFLFGTTSGCTFPVGKPDIPFAEFFAGSDALYPQTYWRAMEYDKTLGKDVPTAIHGGTPAESMKRGLAAWTPGSLGKPIMPMAGEINIATAAEIASYGVALAEQGASEANFYADETDVKPEVLEAIKAL